MKTAGIRFIQHNLKEALSWVRDGETVLITSRGEPVAKLTPASQDGGPKELPDFGAIQQDVYGNKVAPCSVSALQDARADRL